MNDDTQQACGEEGDERATEQDRDQQTDDEAVFLDLKLGTAWGESITKARAAELEARLQAWEQEADHGERRGPFAGARLVGAEVRWLAERVRADWGSVPDLHLEGAKLFHAHLESATLGYAHLEGASLYDVHLEGATLESAHLQGVNLGRAHLNGANIHDAFFDQATYLQGVALSDSTHGAIRLADVHWGEVNLALVDWTAVPVLGDEQVARTSASPRHARATRSPATTTTVTAPPHHTRRQAHQEAAAKRLHAFQAAARANRQLATALRAQGITDDADHYAYRAQVCQRIVFRLKRQWGAWVLQTLLAVLAGYGYRLWRIFAAYVLLVGLFAAAFLAATVVASRAAPTASQVVDALQISLNAIHGRVFFAQFHLDTVQSWLATAESIIGIVIEGVFVAMLVQRFFGGR